MKKWLLLNESKLEKNEDIIDALLANRGIKTKKEIEEFFSPALDQLSLEKVGLKNSELEKATKRIKAAIKNKESIVVYTDYDVDGVASGAIVWEALYHLGANAMPYVPHRIEEGYGLSEKGIDTIYSKHKVNLIITVDHGVTAWEKVAYANSLGIDVIILDHHTIPKKLPESYALIHTTNLCATGIAWFFANYLLDKSENTSNLDLVALATIADLIPLTGVNRILVKYGLLEINKTKRLGLKALINSSGLKLGDIGVYEIGHMLAPRINASGRITHALDSLRLLCTKDDSRAQLLAENLSSINRDRQVILTDTIVHVKENLKIKNQKAKLIFIADESYNQGVIGLVAGKLVEEYYRPAIIISKGEKFSKASARSITGFNIVEALRKCSDLLVDVGGHPMAAGFTVKTHKLLLLEKKLMEIAEKELTEEKLQRIIKIDCEIDLENVNSELYGNLENLGPFGMGNPIPTFVSKNIKVQKMRIIGKDKKHLKITLQPNSKFNQSRLAGQYIDAIGFGMSSFFEEFLLGKAVDVAYTIDEDNWNIKNNWSNLHTNLQLKLKDVKMSKV